MSQLGEVGEHSEQSSVKTIQQYQPLTGDTYTRRVTWSRQTTEASSQETVDDTDFHQDAQSEALT